MHRSRNQSCLYISVSDLFEFPKVTNPAPQSGIHVQIAVGLQLYLAGLGSPPRRCKQDPTNPTETAVGLCWFVAVSLVLQSLQSVWCILASSHIVLSSCTQACRYLHNLLSYQLPASVLGALFVALVADLFMSLL